MGCPEMDYGTMGYNRSRERTADDETPKAPPGVRVDTRGRPISTGYYYVMVDAAGAELWIRHEPPKEGDDAPY
jgi:hypothetical protein